MGGSEEKGEKEKRRGKKGEKEREKKERRKAQELLWKWLSSIKLPIFPLLGLVPILASEDHGNANYLRWRAKRGALRSKWGAVWLVVLACPARSAAVAGSREWVVCASPVLAARAGLASAPFDVAPPLSMSSLYTWPWRRQQKARDGDAAHKNNCFDRRRGSLRWRRGQGRVLGKGWVG